MNTVFVLLSVQAIMGAFDNLWHHELQAKLPQRVSARWELALHAAREAIYAVLFIGLAWWEWRGLWAGVLAVLLLAELLITLTDFLEEDRTRRLPPFERLLHTVLTISYGLFLGLMGPVLLQWAQAPSAMHFSEHGWVSGLFTLYGIGVAAWSVRNVLAVLQLRRMAAALADSHPHSERAGTAHRVLPAVLVTGATGFIGSALVHDLLRSGQRVIVLSRDARQAQAMWGARMWVVESLDAIPSETRIGAIVHLAGARVLGMPWTRARRQTLLESRVQLTTALLGLMRRLEQPVRVLVSASAVGYYGATPDAAPTALDETQNPRAGEFQSDLCVAMEHEARRAEGLGVRVVRLRFGVVLGRGDGAYPLQALAARLGLGAVLGSGRQSAPWIHLDDAVGLIRFALAHEHMAGAVNAVAPDTPSQAGFAKALAASFGRSVHWRMPAGVLRAALGEMATLLVDGQHVVPRVALACGYRFAHPRLAGALAALATCKTLPPAP